MVAMTLDTREVLAATTKTLSELGKLTGFSQRQVLLGFAGVVLKQWAGRTKVATEDEVDRRTRYRAVRDLRYTRAFSRGDVTVNSGYKAAYGRVWIKVRNGNSKNNFVMAKGNGFTAPVGKATFTYFRRSTKSLGGRSGKWFANVADAVADVPPAVQRAQDRGRQSIGLARQSVVQIADALGIDLLTVQGGGTLSANGIAKARAALASTGKFNRNGTGTQGGSGAYDYVTLINTLPYARAIGMDRTLLGVLNGQNKYFAQSYSKGAFDTQERICRAYPNLFKFSRS